jgi:hypothetical protein
MRGTQLPLPQVARNTSFATIDDADMLVETTYVCDESSSLPGVEPTVCSEESPSTPAESQKAGVIAAIFAYVSSMWASLSHFSLTAKKDDSATKVVEWCVMAKITRLMANQQRNLREAHERDHEERQRTKKEQEKREITTDEIKWHQKRHDLRFERIHLDVVRSEAEQAHKNEVRTGI